ncbi:Tetratricopeptide repeat-containing protein [Terribacillus aidingensis]|uniref:Tetratricopeptide repeat-containing protein n=1 Tax=Terribacillus aidingensis TaxID=586416 RepID=A0A285N6Q1_9BACI|nr:glycosyltransferase [Terribacillus aidingensis]SNZ05155.1 Tetratricopeptide repeat-containing protein [Terribacillus aidingensis]
MNKPQVSLCMIVKNEEKVIGRCLDSVVNLVDDIVIVDTGSTDRTIEIIKEYESARLFHYKWNNNFADARNFAASQAIGDWILVLDADEFLETGNAKHVIDNLKYTKEDVFAINIVNFVGVDGTRTLENKHVRLYRNTGKYHYTRAIHEQLVHKDNKNITVNLSDLIAYHSGYLDDVVKKKSKTDRNTKLLKLQLKKGKEGFDYYNLGNELKKEKKYEQALDAYLKAYKKKEDPFINWVPICLLNIIETLFTLNRYNDALEILKDATRIYSDAADFLYMKGAIYLAQGRKEDAKQVFTLILSERASFKTVVKSSDFIEYLPALRLGRVYEIEKNMDKAVQYYSKALNVNNHCFESLTSLMRLFAIHTSIKETLDFAKPFLKNNLEDVLLFVLNDGLYELADLITQEFEIEENILDIIQVKISLIQNKALKNDLFGKDEQKLALALKKKYLDAGDIYLLNRLNPSQELSQVYKSIIRNSFLAFLIDKEFDVSVLQKEEYTSEFCYMIRKLLKYNNYEVANELLDYVNLFAPSVYAKLGGIFFSLSQEDLAMSFYEKAESHTLESQDFLNVILWLRAQENKQEANRIAKEALGKFQGDYRFYEQIIETDSDPEPYLMEALDIYKDSITFEQMLLEI